MQFSDVKDFPAIPAIGGRKVEGATLKELEEKGTTLITYGVNEGDVIVFPATEDQIELKKRQIRPNSDNYEMLLKVVRNNKGSWLSVGVLNRRDHKFNPVHPVAEALTGCANDAERVKEMLGTTIEAKKMVDYTRTKFVNKMRTDEIETAKVAYLTFVEA